MSTAELRLNGTTIISESGGTATLQNAALDAGVTIPSNLDIESATKTALNATGDAPMYACRAWVNFNGATGSGTGFSDITISGSGNVSSITDNGAGYYTVNFATAMPDANYSVLHWGMGEGSLNPNGVIPGGRIPATTLSATYTKVYYANSTTATAVDATYACVAVFR